jgi:hypothetical protein
MAAKPVFGYNRSRKGLCEGGIMKTRAPGTALSRAVLLLMLASLACSNPVQSYLSAQASRGETATATLFTPTATETSTRRPTRTSTPSATLTNTNSQTKTPLPTDTPPASDTPAVGSGTPPGPDKRTATKTGPGSLTGTRFIETAGLTKFSYIPPLGWKKVPATGGNLTYWEGPIQKATIAAMLIFSVEKSDKSAAEAVKEMAGSLTQGSGVKIISQGKFTNDAGLDSYKIVFSSSSQKENIQIVFYFFQKRGYLVEGGYVRLLDLNKDLDAIVDSSMRTIRYE